jgi:hypothetical protein
MLLSELNQASTYCLDEASIKAAFLNYQIAIGAIDRTWRLSSEYGFDNSTRRADLALLGQGRFIGVEIKSERDTLKRLSGQLDAYLQTFDEVILVVAERHLTAALKICPDAVSIYLISSQGEISTVRISAPRLADVVLINKRRLLHGLSKRELLTLVDSGTIKRQSRANLIEDAVMMPISTIRDALHASFNQRFKTTSDNFWRRTKNKRINISHMNTLSRFAKRRNEWIKLHKKTELFWKSWSKEAEAVFSNYLDEVN